MSTRRTARGGWTYVAAVSSVALVVVACRQIVGIHDDPEFHGAAGDGGVDAGIEAGPACGLAIANDGCRACAEANCCDLTRSCANDPACTAFERCSIACQGEPACRSQCVIEHPVGSIPFVPQLDACLATTCVDACGLACGGSIAFTTPEAGAACAKCANAVGCSELEACNRNPECQAILHCTACATEDCLVACEATHDAGARDFNSLLAIAAGNCVSECAAGENWSCVGHRTWPLPKAPTIVITDQLVLFGGTTPAKDVDVKLCETLLPSCMPEVDHTTSDADGGFVLTERGLSPLVQSQLVFLDVSSSTNAIVPMLGFPSFPFSEPDARVISPLTVFPPATFALIAAQASATPDPTRGHIFIKAHDCAYAAAPHVSFSASSGLDGTSSKFYIVTGSFSNAPSETDLSGVGGFFNVNPGSVTITATPKALGKPSSQVSVMVRAGAITSVSMPPTP